MFSCKRWGAQKLHRSIELFWRFRIICVFSQLQQLTLWQQIYVAMKASFGWELARSMSNLPWSLCALVTSAFWSGQWFCLWNSGRRRSIKASYVTLESLKRVDIVLFSWSNRNGELWFDLMTTVRESKLSGWKTKADGPLQNSIRVENFSKIIPPWQTFHKIPFSKCARGRMEFTLSPVAQVQAPLQLYINAIFNITMFEDIEGLKGQCNTNTKR